MADLKKGGREEILKLLLLAYPSFISGEEVAHKLGVSRVAVWKEIQKLKARGFPVASGRQGYALLSLPDVLDPPYLCCLLADQPFVQKLVVEKELFSTNTQAKLLAQQGAPEGTLVICEHQKSGRGRMGRSWFSLPGKSLTFSLVVRPPLPPPVSSLALLVGLALAWTLETRGFSPQLKWPNDLLLQGKKVAGVLLESSLEMDLVDYLVVGVGVNLNLLPDEFPSSLREQATSLYIVSGKEWSRVEFLRKFLAVFAPQYHNWKKEGVFTPWIEDYERRSFLRGKKVCASWGKESLEGVAEGIEQDGSLILRVANGERRTLAWGEVSIVS